MKYKAVWQIFGAMFVIGLLLILIGFSVTGLLQSVIGPVGISLSIVATVAFVGLFGVRFVEGSIIRFVVAVVSGTIGGFVGWLVGALCGWYVMGWGEKKKKRLIIS
ncbi:MAG: hypothetical protein ACOCSJ_05700 [Candidatus Natronoplasma sp.]